MPRFEPFIARRYAPSLDVDALDAPPYDVLGEHDLDRLRSAGPHNIVHLDVPQGTAGEDRYANAARLLAEWTRAGILVADPVPSFTLYRMSFTDEMGRPRTTVGVIGALEVVDAGAPGVLPHERTTPKASTDRLDLTRATRANLSPVWGLSLTPGLTTLLEPPGELLAAVADEEGVEHRVERVDEPRRVAPIADAVGASPVLIADGHHRYSIARTYRDEVAGDAALAEPSRLTMAYVGELVTEQLNIAAIHRLYDLDADQLAAALSEHFELGKACQVGPSILAEMIERGCLCLVATDGSGRFLHPRADRLAGVRQLDGALLEAALGVPGVDGAIEPSYQHGIVEVLAALAEGKARAAVLIRPTTLDEIRRTADEGLLMPPKSKFFTPKLRTGLLIRCLEDGPRTSIEGADPPARSVEELPKESS